MLLLATLLLQVGSWEPPTYLKASGAAGEAWFGNSVATSGGTLVAGACYEGSIASTSGAAYVFVNNGTGWSQQAALKASNAGPGDAFGWSVAIDGDTIVVGALQEDGLIGTDNDSMDVGAAYVFTRTGTTWTQQAILKAGNAQYGDRFGISVAISGDTIVVGADSESSRATGVNGNGADNGVISAGAAYVFTRTGTTWTQQAYLKASNPGYNDKFGSTVAIESDTVVVTAPNEAGNGISQSDDSMEYAGAAYVFTRSGSTWTPQAYLKATHPAAAAMFGFSAALDGETLAIGARGEDNSNGAVHVFTRTGSIWSPQALLKASNAEAGDRLGWSVAISGDRILAGARDEDSSATGVGPSSSDNMASRSGAAYTFERSGTTWREVAYIKASNTRSDDQFGGSVALGSVFAIVGAANVDDPGTNSGAVYAYAIPLPPVAPTDLAQFNASGASIGAAGTTHVHADLRAAVSDPNGEYVYLEIEIKPTGTPFDGVTGLFVSGLGDSGRTAFAPVHGLAGPCHWRARTFDAGGLHSDWVCYGANPDNVGETDINFTNAKPVSTRAAQLRGSDGNELSLGGQVVDADEVRFDADGSDPDGDTFHVQVEVCPVGERFSGAPTLEGSTSVGGRSSARWTLPQRMHYHWQYRLVDVLGATSDWKSFGGNDEASTDLEVVWIGSIGHAACLGAAAGAPLWLPALGVLVILAIRRFR